MGSKDNEYVCYEIKKLDHSEDLTSLAFSHDGKNFASSSWDGTVKVWDVKTKECKMIVEDQDDEDQCGMFCVKFSPNGKYLATNSNDKDNDGALKLWDMDSGLCARTLEGNCGHVESITFSHDGKYLVSGNFNKTVKLWLVESGECIRTMEGHDDVVNSITISPNGKYIVSSGRGDRNMKLWSVDTGLCLRTIECIDTIRFQRSSYRWTEDEHVDNTGFCAVNCVAFSPDKKYLASCGMDSNVKLWCLKSLECIRYFFSQRNGYRDIVKMIAFSPDGKYLAGCIECYMKLWNVESGECIMTIKEGGDVDIISFSPNGHYITLGINGYNQSVRFVKSKFLLSIEQGRKRLYTFLTCLLRNCNKGKLPDTIYHGFNSIGPSNIILQMLSSYDPNF